MECMTIAVKKNVMDFTADFYFPLHFLAAIIIMVYITYIVS